MKTQTKNTKILHRYLFRCNEKEADENIKDCMARKKQKDVRKEVSKMLEGF